MYSKNVTIQCIVLGSQSLNSLWTSEDQLLFIERDSLAIQKHTYHKPRQSKCFLSTHKTAGISQQPGNRTDWIHTYHPMTKKTIRCDRDYQGWLEGREGRVRTRTNRKSYCSNSILRFVHTNIIRDSMNRICWNGILKPLFKNKRTLSKTAWDN
jgi:hypothetical protein